MGTIMEELANVEPRERYRQLFRRLRTEYEKRGLPLSGRFELTPHCTLDCKMCYVHRADGKYPHRVLTGDEWIGLMDQAVELGMMHATLTGGECMLHPDFKRVYTHLRKKGVYVSLLTNGTLIDGEMLELLKTMPPHRVQITLYGSNDAVYERVTGKKGMFDRVIAAIKSLQEALICTDIALTISKYNQDDVKNLWDLAHSLIEGRVLIECDLIDPAEDCGNDYETYALSYDEQYAIRKNVLEWEKGSACDICDEDFAEQGGAREGYPDTIPCAAGLSLFDIGYYGMMCPCNNFLLASADAMELGVAKAWQIINTAARAYRRSEECRFCEFYGKCRFCAARYLQTQHEPCDKHLHMLIPTLYAKNKK